jgi:hypothetical protein
MIQKRQRTKKININKIWIQKGRKEGYSKHYRRQLPVQKPRYVSVSLQRDFLFTLSLLGIFFRTHLYDRPLGLRYGTHILLLIVPSASPKQPLTGQLSLFFDVLLTPRHLASPLSLRLNACSAEYMSLTREPQQPKCSLNRFPTFI